MTLIATINGRDSIWMLADRRLSFNNRPPRDDARKVMFLETDDGVAILGYAGLGATALGTEPSDWMSSVLRGRNHPLEQSLGVIAEAMKKQFPRHLVGMPGHGVPAHNVLVTALVASEVRFYSIELAIAPDGKNHRFLYKRRVSGTSATAPRFGLGGSGGLHLTHDARWVRPLLRLVGAYDRGQISALMVADQLASLNHYVHLGVADKSVGPRCIVAWRNKKEGTAHKGGSGQQFYSGKTRDRNSESLPTITSGMDLHAIVGVLVPRVSEVLQAMQAGGPAKDLDQDELNAELARLPDKPSEDLP